jgi:hypothetical protein
MLSERDFFAAPQIPDAIPTFGVNSRCATPARRELIASRQCVIPGVRLAFGESVDAI